MRDAAAAGRKDGPTSERGGGGGAGRGEGGEEGGEEVGRRGEKINVGKFFILATAVDG